MAGLRKKGLTFLATMLLMLVLPCAASAVARPLQGGENQVLILNSYHPYYSWSDNEVDGIVEVLKKNRPDIIPIVQHLDCDRFPDLQQFPDLAALFKRKYRQLNIPLVVVADNPALLFAQRYRQDIFPQASIIFCGINGYEARMIKGQNRITGIAERADTRGTVRTMLRLHPETREILVIHDYTATGLASRREAEQDLKGLTKKVSFRFIDDLSIKELVKEVSRLPSTSLILSLNYERDREGQSFDHGRIADVLSKNSPVPVYGTYEESLGHGIVGGSLLGGKEHAVRAAHVALEILDGRGTDSLQVFTGTDGTLMFDYNQLKRFDIQLSQLPEGSVVINKQLTFYQRYTRLVWITILVFIVLCTIITFLIIYIAQNRRLTTELAGNASELELTNAELREFSMVAYHDLQEPLRNIMGFAQLLQKRYKGRLDQEADEYIDLVMNNVSHLKQLFNDLLAYMQLGKSKPERYLVDSRQLVEEVINDLNGHFQADHAITLQNLPQVKADPALLAKTFQHLITNALKFCKTRPEITISAKQRLNEVIFSISDNGIGIEPQYYEKIFHIFRKLHSHKEYPGTGIGLSICKRSIELHGGRIWVVSEPGKGTTFYFSLPM